MTANVRALHFISATLILFIASIAKAGLYIEPLVGYQMGNYEYQVKSAFGGASGKGSLTGIAYGAELGYNFSKLRLALDFQMANQEQKPESAGTTTKLNTTTYAGIIGYEFPEKIVGYLGVGMATSVDDAVPKNTMTGMVLKAGGSKELVHHVSVSVEYLMYTWNDTAAEGGSTTKIADYYDKFNSSGIQANIRFPFEFGGK